MGCDAVCSRLQTQLGRSVGVWQDIVHQSCFYLQGAGRKEGGDWKEKGEGVALQEEDAIACESGPVHVIITYRTCVYLTGWCVCMTVTSSLLASGALRAASLVAR